MRTLHLLIFATASLYGCSCVTNASPCTAVSGDTIVMVAKVLVDSGEGWGTGPARVIVEEALHNVPQDLAETDIYTQAGSSCYRRLVAGDRYVIYASKDRASGRLSTGACSSTFNVRGNEHILDGIRNLVQGGPPMIVGQVTKSRSRYAREQGVEGAQVVARSDSNRFVTTADAFGVYEIRNVPPGRYLLDVSKENFVPDSEYNHRWSGRLVADETTRRIEPDTTMPGSVVVGKTCCAVWDLSMWSNGRISGIIRNSDGQPIKGVLVQAFATDDRGAQESEPLRVAVSGEDGSYQLDRLPSATYLIGVNADKYQDRSPYRPTLYAKEGVRLYDAERRSGIDLTLAPPRTPAKLRVTVIAPADDSGGLFAVSLQDLNGEQKGFYRADENHPTDPIEAPVYVGERYLVEAYAGRLQGTARVDIASTESSVAVFVTGEKK